MPYEHDAPVPNYEPPAQRRPWFVPPAPFRWSPASMVVVAVLTAPLVLTGLWRDQATWFAVWVVAVLASRPIAWLLWTRRRP